MRPRKLVNKFYFFIYFNIFVYCIFIFIFILGEPTPQQKDEFQKLPNDLDELNALLVIKFFIIFYLFIEFYNFNF